MKKPRRIASKDERGKPSEEFQKLIDMITKSGILIDRFNIDPAKKEDQERKFEQPNFKGKLYAYEGEEGNYFDVTNKKSFNALIKAAKDGGLASYSLGRPDTARIALISLPH